MSGASAASQIASVMRAAVANKTHAARKAVKPEHIAGNIKLSTPGSHGAQSSVQFDATGQIVPSAKGVRKNSATANFVNLLA